MALIKRRPVTAFTFEDGCKLDEPHSLFIALYAATDGDPCDGCSHKPCSLLDRFQREDKQGFRPTVGEPGLKTNAELAAEHGITKRQAAKRRIAGTNDLMEAQDGN